MPKLPPRVGVVNDKNFLGFVPHKDVDFNFIGYLLACHLVIEHYLDEFLLSRAPDLMWEKPRLTFAQKADLFPHAMFPNGDEVIAGIRHINALRNKLAHKLETKPEEFEYLPFTRFLEKSNCESVPTTPLELLEAFVNTLSAYFMGWLASDAYRTRWRQNMQQAES
ncbi:hypothetical protein [Roseateles toxinivorans]|uniref:Uncharacterized protein n=1 Tax=Roseateles toxinivorans TaxID=270368 RepID=A0A4R6QQZ1_9BURK|nr:hypothetical protein [Roseateles toxinivorans]TDP71704.1 hypothetical protein DES47_103686 [Roseateles toxinivorans]